MSEDRFKTIEKKVDKVEDKLDRITEILATQAEHNQRLVNLAEREQRSEERLDQLEKDVTTISKNVQQNATAASIGVWLINHRGQCGDRYCGWGWLSQTIKQVRSHGKTHKIHRIHVW